MKTIIIGVMPQEQIRARAIAIAKGEYKPKSGEPKIWNFYARRPMSGRS